MSHHVCNVAGCTKVLSKDLLMCPIHWRLVPKPIQLKVWRNYKVGQTIATATDEWKEAAKEATLVATQESISI